MQNGIRFLAVLSLVIAVSGCTDGSQETESQGNQAVTVDQLQVTPTEIREDSNVRVRMGITNSGQLPSKVELGSSEGSIDGNQILTNHCPDVFDIEEFSASSSNSSQTQSSYNLAPGTSIQMNWNLNQNTGNVPLNGYQCQLKFEVPFEYNVEAFRQIQVKSSDDIQGTEDLFSKSSKGPMKIEMETIGSSSEKGAPTFLEEDNAEVLVQLESKEPDESSYTGTVELSPPDIEARSINFDGECPDPENIPPSGNLRLYDGGSKVFRCPLNWDLSEGNSPVPSIRGEVYARADYTYVKDAGTRNVEVKSRGG